MVLRRSKELTFIYTPSPICQASICIFSSGLPKSCASRRYHTHCTHEKTEARRGKVVTYGHPAQAGCDGARFRPSFQDCWKVVSRCQKGQEMAGAGRGGARNKGDGAICGVTHPPTPPCRQQPGISWVWCLFFFLRFFLIKYFILFFNFTILYWFSHISK